MRTVNFGLIGLGMMGVEFASAVMRWSHLVDTSVRPKIVSICSRTLKPEVEKWYREGLGTVTQAARDYKEVLANPEVEFLHSSDLDPDKPINWKRKIQFNGEYGCMGDLGMHILAVPFRAGWVPKNVRAILSNLVPERPDGAGGTAACETWDNATLLCETEARAASAAAGGEPFPLTVKTHRISPGEKNTWAIRIKGMKGSAAFSTKNINSIEILEYTGGEQAWQQVDLGHETPFKSVTGPIFEFGFSDSMLQMIAAYLYELEYGRPKTKFAGCVTPEETALSHRLFTAALQSQRTGAAAEV